MKLDGGYTKKNELIGTVHLEDFPAKLVFSHLIEETKIRIDNHQNIILVALIFINALIKRIFKVL